MSLHSLCNDIFFNVLALMAYRHYFVITTVRQSVQKLNLFLKEVLKSSTLANAVLKI